MPLAEELTRAYRHSGQPTPGGNTSASVEPARSILALGLRGAGRGGRGGITKDEVRCLSSLGEGRQAHYSPRRRFDDVAGEAGRIDRRPSR